MGELAERQKLQLRNKAIKKGLDPESFTGKHPPTIHMFSKYERRTDTRTYGDRKKLYEGGAEVIRAEWLESMWKEKFAEFSKRPAKKLPKWFGVRPGKRKEIRRRPRARRRPLLRRPPRRNTRRKRRITRRRRKRSKLKAVPNFHHHLLGLKSKSYPCNKRHSIRVIASIPRGSPGNHLPRELHNLQFVIAI